MSRVKRLMKAAGLICGVLSLLACGHPERLLVEGNNAYRRGDPAAAAAAYAQALQFEETRTTASLNLGRLYQEGNEPKRAMEFLDKGLAERPDFALGLLCRARARLALDGPTVTVEKDLLKAVEIDPGLSQAWLELAKVEMAQGRFEDALKSCGQAGTIVAHLEEVTDLKVKCHRQLGRKADIIADLEFLVASQPHLVRPYFDLGHELLQATEYREAARRLGEGLALDPTDRQGRLDLALALEGSGAEAEAIRQFEAVLATPVAGAPPGRVDDALTLLAQNRLNSLKAPSTSK